MESTKVPAFIINTTYRLESEDVDAFSALAARISINAAKREGRLFLHAAQDVLDLNIFQLFEGWASRKPSMRTLQAKTSRALCMKRCDYGLPAASATSSWCPG